MNERKMDDAPKTPDAPPAPEPSVDLQAVPAIPKWVKTLTKATFVTMAGVAAVPLLCMSTETRGATRSSKLAWQERQAELTREIAEVDASEASHDDAR